MQQALGSKGGEREKRRSLEGQRGRVVYIRYNLSPPIRPGFESRLVLVGGCNLDVCGVQYSRVQSGIQKSRLRYGSGSFARGVQLRWCGADGRTGWYGMVQSGCDPDGSHSQDMVSSKHNAQLNSESPVRLLRQGTRPRATGYGWLSY